MQNVIKKQYGKVIVSDIITGLGKGKVAVLKQEFVKEYGTVPDYKDGMDYTESNFKGNGKKYKSIRVALFYVNPGTSREGFQATLDGYPTAHIYRIMSRNHTDVMEDRQMYAIYSGESSVTMDWYKEKLRAKTSEGNLLYYKGEPYYIGFKFVYSYSEDIDARDISKEFVDTTVKDKKLDLEFIDKIILKLDIPIIEEKEGLPNDDLESSFEKYI